MEGYVRGEAVFLKLDVQRSSMRGKGQPWSDSVVANRVRESWVHHELGANFDVSVIRQDTWIPGGKAFRVAVVSTALFGFRIR